MVYIPSLWNLLECLFQASCSRLILWNGSSGPFRCSNSILSLSPKSYQVPLYQLGAFFSGPLPHQHESHL